MTAAAAPLLSSNGPKSASNTFVIFRDRDGRRHAVRRHGVTALVEDDAGTTTALLHGGRVVVLEDDLDTVLRLFA